MAAIDKKENYFSFMHENQNAPVINHRLGNFRAWGRGTSTVPKTLGVLHVPQWDFKAGDVTDHSAEDMCNYQSSRPDPASVHIYADSDSFDLALPADWICYGCANPNTALYSIEAEISGYMSYPKDHWLSQTGSKKLENTAKAYVQLYLLQYGPSWKDHAIPAVIGKVTPEGKVDVAGFVQHRDIPIWSKGSWHQPPESFNLGQNSQHQDISPDFPMDHFLEIYKKLIV